MVMQTKWGGGGGKAIEITGYLYLVSSATT